jgi:error-prone DNA polymerase
MFEHLNVRSAYSLLYGVRTVTDILDRAKEAGCSTLAVTDIDNIYGVHSFIEAAKERGIRPIVGAELTSKAGRVVALVRDRTGFGNLCEILTERRRESFDLVGALSRLSGGLVLVTDSPVLVDSLAGRVSSLYAGVSPATCRAVPAARARGIPLAALGDATFLASEDLAVHRVLRAVALGKTVGNLAEADLASSSSLFRTPGEVERRLRSWPEAIGATAEIARLCTFDTIFDGFIFPSYAAPLGMDAASALRERTLAGAEKRYGELSEGVLDRIEYELGIIAEKGFSDYFLVVAEIVALASRTCGRGSGAASIVSYSLGITNVDPIRHHLYFERFLNPSRIDPPDIDVDFAWDERDDLIRKTIELFGSDRCARVANHNLFRPRAALRETAKAYGLPDGEISVMERKLFDLGKAEGADEAPWPEILSIAKRIEGLPRGLGMHCGGIVIAPGPIRRYAPIESSAEGYPLLAWEKEGTEASGLVKIDLLGNRSLAVIRDALTNLEEEGIRIDPFTWRPTEDEATVAALARGDSIGVFYIESPAMRQLQKKTGRGDYEHIVIHSSIIRPAANKYIAEYVRRLKGEPYEDIHPRLAKIFDETYGILCYQEDVSKTAIALAGFDESDADKLRKILSKNPGSARLAAYEAKFREGYLKNGVSEETGREVWEMILSFQGYSFCKPHSASYAMVSFQSAWLRVHHPAEFMAAVIANQGGYYTAQAYISEARRMGLAIEGPDVNLSRYRYHAKTGALVIGFMAIRALSRSAVDAILIDRERNGPFSDAADFSRRLRLGQDDLLALLQSGSFDSLFPRVPRTEQARMILGSATSSVTVQRGLFEPSERRLSPRAVPTASRSSGEEEALRAEYRTLGFLRARHPLELWASKVSKIRRVRACDLPSLVGRHVALIGWPITQKQVLTAEGRAMEFVSFEDETALYETVLFPEAYDRFRILLFDQAPLIIAGVVDEDEGAINVNITKMTRI